MPFQRWKTQKIRIYNCLCSKDTFELFREQDLQIIWLGTLFSYLITENIFAFGCSRSCRVFWWGKCFWTVKMPNNMTQRQRPLLTHIPKQRVAVQMCHSLLRIASNGNTVDLFDLHLWIKPIRKKTTWNVVLCYLFILLVGSGGGTDGSNL